MSRFLQTNNMLYKFASALVRRRAAVMKFSEYVNIAALPEHHNSMVENYAAQLIRSEFSIITENSKDGLGVVTVTTDPKLPVILRVVSELDLSRPFKIAEPTEAMRHMFFSEKDAIQVPELIGRGAVDDTCDLGLIVFVRERGTVSFMNVLQMENLSVGADTGFQTLYNKMGIVPGRSVEESREYFKDLYIEFLKIRAQPYGQLLEKKAL